MTARRLAAVACIAVALAAASGARAAGTAGDSYRAICAREWALAAPGGAGADAGGRATAMSAAADSAGIVVTAHRRLWLAPSTPDQWLASDKALHFSVSYGAFFTFRLAEDTSTQAALSAFGLGVLKEAHDVWMRPPGPAQGASWKDLVVDAVGVAAGALVWSALSP